MNTARVNRQDAWGPGLIAALLSVAGWTIFWRFMLRSHPTIARENGPMENLQLVCIVVGMVCFLVAALRVRDSGWRTLLGALILFYATFLLLEADVRDSGIRILVRLLNGPIRNAWLGLCWLLAAIAFFRNRDSTWSAFRAWIRTSSAVVLILSGGLWLAATLVDKSILIQKSLFKEEVLEVCAAWLMLQAAVQLCRSGQASASSHPV